LNGGISGEFSMETSYTFCSSYDTELFCGADNVDTLLADFDAACGYNADWTDLEFFDFFDTVCSWDSDCYSAWSAVWYILYCDNAMENTDLMTRVGLTEEVAAHCPSDGQHCDSETFQMAVDAYGTDCDCADLMYLLGNTTAFAEDTTGALYGAAYAACTAGVCLPAATSVGDCIDAQSVLYSCAWPESILYPLETSVNLPIIQSCPNVENVCDHEHIVDLLATFTTDCGATATAQHMALCDHTNTDCAAAADALYSCSPYASFADSMTIGMIGTSQSNCMITGWTPASCSGATLTASVTTFMTACDQCKPDGDMGKCTTQICGAAAGSACANAYMAINACFLQVTATADATLSNIVNSIAPLGQYCQTTADECSQTAVSLALNALTHTCDCADAADCLSKAQDCSLFMNSECNAAASELIIKCGKFAATLDATSQDIFTKASGAMVACSAPKCDSTYHLAGPFQLDTTVECCNPDTGKGAHGVDGACCLRNSKQTDDTQPNAFTNPLDKDAKCCYVPTTGDKKGFCPTSGASSTAATVATLIATAAALLL